MKFNAKKQQQNDINRNIEGVEEARPIKKADRRRAYRIVSLITVLAVAIGAIGINILVYFLSDEYNLNFDVSNERLYSLSDETKELIEGLNQDIYIYSLYPTGEEDRYVSKLLDNYDAASERIKVENIDPTLNPGFTAKYDPDSSGISTGSVIISNADGSMYDVLTVFDMFTFSQDYSAVYYFRAEQRIDSSINYILTGKSYGIRFLTGHDEDSLSDLSMLAADLSGLGYDVSTYNAMSSTDKLDPARDTLVVVSPRSDLADDEYENIKEFLTSGGNAIFIISYAFVDSAGTNQIINDNLDNFNSLLMMYNLKVNRDLVIGGDQNKIYGNQLSLIPTMYSHDITNNIIDAGEKQIMADCSSITISDKSTAAGLIWTDETTWAKDLSGKVVNVEKQDGDEQGPFAIGALGAANGSQIALYTSSSFIQSNSLGIERAGNRDLFVNTISVLAKKDDASNVEAKSLLQGSMQFDNAWQATLMEIIVIAVIPVAILVFGVVIWVGRKRR